MNDTGHSVEQELETQTRRLIDEFRGVVPPEEVRREVERAFEDHRTARIRTYVPIFTYRAARSALRRLAPTSETRG